ncbi:response regulator [Aquimarina sp. 2201CG5-10]|uniref:hybrid sensor histidine kinase/response regulator transcription factor n=1 Tax=Aquimarina callyspongiae TaxID=3098150 RepID=UPI002AB42B02|nr:response regulator [Aquimarina sp. 2201CG5-10]MDY8134176.1 response regulator [Aquimarina sp. 2201CG5-10]
MKFIPQIAFVSKKKYTYLSDSFLINLIAFFLFFASCLGQENLNFIHFDQTFSGDSKIAEGPLGYIWIINPSGIYKYDGYTSSFIPHQQIFGDNFSNDRQFFLKKDTRENFWVSSFHGELSKLEVQEGIYTSYKDSLAFGKKKAQISSIESNKDQVWFGSAKGILYRYDYKTSKIDSIAALPVLKKLPQKIIDITFTDDKIWVSTTHGRIYNYSISTGTIEELTWPEINYFQNIRITTDNKEALWIFTEHGGIFNYKPTGGYEKKIIKPENSVSTSKNIMFLTVFRDRSGIIWAGTDGDGLYKINPEDNTISNYKHEEVNNLSISNNTITHINEDSYGNLWIVLKQGLINILPKNNPKIQYYNGLENNAPMRILSMLKSSDGSLWIGTDGKGLNRIFPNNDKIQYDLTKKEKHFFKGRYIQSLVEDSIGNIWIATYLNGLWVYDIRREVFTKIRKNDPEKRPPSDVRYLFKDSRNRIWATSNRGIQVFSDNQEQLAFFDYQSNGAFGKISSSITQDENGTIWVGITDGGLFKFNEDVNNLDNSYFTRVNYYEKKDNDLLNYNINSLTADYNENLWILLTSNVLIKYNLKDGTFINHAAHNNLKDIKIVSLLIEDPENLWCGSNNGIHHYNTKANTIKSYYQIDGLQSNIFVRKSSYKDKEGKFYFGNNDGVNAFFPDQINPKETSSKLYINTIEILNQPGQKLLKNQLSGSIENVKKIDLKANHSSFSFQFSAVGNLLNPNYHYAYRLKGFDQEWIVPKKNRIANYTNIPSGSYTFEVKAGSKKNEWNIEPVSISLNIKPPWWKSPLAYTLYLVLISLLTYGIITWLRLKNKLAKEEWQNNKEKELYALKMNFFAKMSHEIQTPLTLILGPIDDMLNRAENNKSQLLRQRLSMIKNNANRLSRIAMELMTVRNKELGKLRVFASKNDLIDDLKNIATSFAEQARFKKIDFIQEYPTEEVIIWYDQEKIEHVIYNLLSNAFKFTPREGSITLKVNYDSIIEGVKISVIDSGPGIPKEELNHIFKLFYQSELGKHVKGHGIGLALSKELISLHHGKIDVFSSQENGTSFIISLCTGEDVFSKDEKIFSESSKQLSQAVYQEKVITSINESKSSQDNEYTLLIVEDNIEMQIFLRDVLSNTYNLLIAENGKQGIALAEKHNPDVIISDIMMPVMNGIEMCKTLQKKKSTSHIPIIILTAKNSTKTKIAGLKSGAIEYIQKPFNFHELLLKVDNLITNRDNILSKYRTDSISTPSEVFIESKDEIFMKNLVEELSKQLENSNYKLESLSKSIGMSYSVIYRKCQDITGKTLVDFLRSLKLKRAALLIIEHQYNISEAAFMVGYKDSKYFTKCFKDEFGIPPAYLKKEVKNREIEDLLKQYDLKRTPS